MKDEYQEKSGWKYLKNTTIEVCAIRFKSLKDIGIRTRISALLEKGLINFSDPCIT